MQSGGLKTGTERRKPRTTNNTTQNQQQFLKTQMRTRLSHSRQLWPQSAAGTLLGLHLAQRNAER
jgi:hypothetical protein